MKSSSKPRLPIKLSELEVGDALKLRSSKSEIVIYKIIHISESRLVYISPKIITVDLFSSEFPKIKHSWDWEFIQLYTESILKAKDLTLLNLLYNLDYEG